MRDLNARLAQALAPVLGREAVYAWGLQCQRGHVNPASRLHLPSGEILCRLQEDGTSWQAGGTLCDSPISEGYVVPMDFEDPAVGWRVWELWALKMGAIERIIPDLLTDRPWFTAVVSNPGDGMAHGGPSMLSALLNAWMAALGVGGDE